MGLNTLLTGIFILILEIGNCQYFQQVYEVPQQDLYFYSMTKLNGGELLAIAQSSTQIQASQYIVKMDSVGNIISCMKFDNSPGIRLHSIYPLTENKFIIQGFKDNDWATLICIDSGLQIIWARNYYSQLNCKFYDLLYDTKRNTIEIVGNINEYYDVDSADYISYGLWMEADTNGNMLLNNGFYYKGINRFLNIYKTADSSYAISSTSDYIDSAFLKKCYHKLKIDTAGNFITSVQNSYQYYIDVDSNGNMYEVVRLDNPNTKFIFSKFDNAGNVVFSKILKIANSSIYPFVSSLKTYNNLIIITSDNGSNLYFDLFGNSLSVSGYNLPPQPGKFSNCKYSDSTFIGIYHNESQSQYTYSVLASENPYSGANSGCNFANNLLSNISTSPPFLALSFFNDTSFIMFDSIFTPTLTSDTILQTLGCATSIHTPNYSGFVLEPNPVIDKLTIKLIGENSIGLKRIEVFNILNTTLLLSQYLFNNEMTIDLSELKPGIYIVKLFGNNLTTRKIIKL